jgi:hypothetical protein
MSATKAIYDMLKNSAGLTAVVPVAKIFAGLIPVNTAMPAIAYNQISAVRPKDIAMVTRIVTARVQVTVMTKNYPQQKAIIDLVRAACDAKQGSFNGVVIDSCVVDIEGPDLRDDDAGLFMQTIDFIVKFSD